MINVAFTILKNEGNYIFQHRDDKPSIASPGLYAGFGGQIEPGEDYLQAAHRELTEETSIEAVIKSFKFLGNFMLAGKSGGNRYCYLLNIDNVDFEVYEGQGKVSFSAKQLHEADLAKFTISTAVAIERYLL